MPSENNPGPEQFKMAPCSEAEAATIQAEIEEVLKRHDADIQILAQPAMRFLKRVKIAANGQDQGQAQGGLTPSPKEFFAGDKDTPPSDSTPA